MINSLIIATFAILCANSLFIVIFYITVRNYAIKPKYVNINIWQNYLDEVVVLEDYIEAERVKNLLESGYEAGFIMLPSGYDLCSTTYEDGTTKDRIIKVV